MARCKLTNMNLRSIRKSREYQCILIDLVSAGVVEQSEAEKLLGYTIPPGLLDGDTPGPDPEPEAETPVITTDLPAAKTISGSDTLTIAASVTDGGTLSYAWTKDGDPIADATAATLTVNEAGTYQCTVTNTLGEDTATAQSTACVVTATEVNPEDPPEEEEEPVTLLYFDATANDNAGAWLTESYDLDDGATAADIIAAAKTAFEDNTIDTVVVVEANPEYVEGTTPLADEFVPLDPQPEAFEPGQFIKCYSA